MPNRFYQNDSSKERKKNCDNERMGFRSYPRNSNASSYSRDSNDPKKSRNTYDSNDPRESINTYNSNDSSYSRESRNSRYPSDSRGSRYSRNRTNDFYSRNNDYTRNSTRNRSTHPDNSHESSDTSPDLHAIIRARYKSDQSFDGRRMRQVIQRKALDWTSGLAEYTTMAKRIVGKGEGFQARQMRYGQLIRKTHHMIYGDRTGGVSSHGSLEQTNSQETSLCSENTQNASGKETSLYSENTQNASTESNIRPLRLHETPLPHHRGDHAVVTSHLSTNGENNSNITPTYDNSNYLFNTPTSDSSRTNLSYTGSVNTAYNCNVNSISPFFSHNLRRKNLFLNMLHHTSINKLRSPINTLCYTPDGRRLITGNANGEFTLWNSFTHSFETIMQAHDSPIRKITFSSDQTLLLSADSNGTLKCWYLSLNNVLSRNISQTAIRDITTMNQFVITAGDDSLIAVHEYEALARTSNSADSGNYINTGRHGDSGSSDRHSHVHSGDSRNPGNSNFQSNSGNSSNPGHKQNYSTTSVPDDYEPRAVLRGHNWDIRVCRANPSNSLLLSGGKDNLVKLWDLRTNGCIRTYHHHKNSVMTGCWLDEHTFLTGSRDCTTRMVDIRNDRCVIYRSRREVTAIAAYNRGYYNSSIEIQHPAIPEEINKEDNTEKYYNGDWTSYINNSVTDKSSTTGQFNKSSYTVRTRTGKVNIPKGNSVTDKNTAGQLKNSLNESATVQINKVNGSTPGGIKSGCNSGIGFNSSIGIDEDIAIPDNTKEENSLVQTNESRIVDQVKRTDSTPESRTRRVSDSVKRTDSTLKSRREFNNLRPDLNKKNNSISGVNTNYFEENEQILYDELFLDREPRIHGHFNNNYNNDRELHRLLTNPCTLTSYPKLFTVGHSDGTLMIYSTDNLEGIELKGREGQISSELNQAYTQGQGIFNISQGNPVPIKDYSIENIRLAPREFIEVSPYEPDGHSDTLNWPHNQCVWDICYHPVGHLMATGSMDMGLKIWGWE